MLGADRRLVVRFGIACRCYLLYCSIVLLLVLVQFVIADEGSCTRSTQRDQLRQSFKVLKLGHERNIRSCISLCCSKGGCDLALLKRGRCYGISCSHHDLCRGVMNALRNTKRDISKRSVSETEDFPSDFSHRSRFQGFCRKKRVIPHHVFLQGGQRVSNFQRLSDDVMNIRKCNKHCCKKKDCSLAFMMRDKCYGVICPDDGECNSSDEIRVPLHLEIALIQRRGLDGNMVVRESPPTKLSQKRKTHHDKHKVKHKSNLKHESGHVGKRRLKHVSKNRHAPPTTINHHHQHQHQHKSSARIAVKQNHKHHTRKYIHGKKHEGKKRKKKNLIRHQRKLRNKKRKQKKRTNEYKMNNADEKMENDEEKKSDKSRIKFDDSGEIEDDLKNNQKEKKKLHDWNKRRNRKTHHKVRQNKKEYKNEDEEELNNDEKKKHTEKSVTHEKGRHRKKKQTKKSVTHEKGRHRKRKHTEKSVTHEKGRHRKKKHTKKSVTHENKRHRKKKHTEKSVTHEKERHRKKKHTEKSVTHEKGRHRKSKGYEKSVTHEKERHRKKKLTEKSVTHEKERHRKSKGYEKSVTHEKERHRKKKLTEKSVTHEKERHRKSKGFIKSDDNVDIDYNKYGEKEHHSEDSDLRNILSRKKHKFTYDKKKENSDDSNIVDSKENTKKDELVEKHKASDSENIEDSERNGDENNEGSEEENSDERHSKGRKFEQTKDENSGNEYGKIKKNYETKDEDEMNENEEKDDSDEMEKDDSDQMETDDEEKNKNDERYKHGDKSDKKKLDDKSMSRNDMPRKSSGTINSKRRYVHKSQKEGNKKNENSFEDYNNDESKTEQKEAKHSEKNLRNRKHEIKKSETEDKENDELGSSQDESGKRKQKGKYSWRPRHNNDDKISESKHKSESEDENTEETKHDTDKSNHVDQKDDRLKEHKSSERDRNDDEINEHPSRRKHHKDQEVSMDKNDGSGSENDNGGYLNDPLNGHGHHAILSHNGYSRDHFSRKEDKPDRLVKDRKYDMENKKDRSNREGNEKDHSRGRGDENDVRDTWIKQDKKGKTKDQSDYDGDEMHISENNEDDDKYHKKENMIKEKKYDDGMGTEKDRYDNFRHEDDRPRDNQDNDVSEKEDNNDQHYNEKKSDLDRPEDTQDKYGGSGSSQGKRVHWAERDSKKYELDEQRDKEHHQDDKESLDNRKHKADHEHLREDEDDQARKGKTENKDFHWSDKKDSKDDNYGKKYNEDALREKSREEEKADANYKKDRGHKKIRLNDLSSNMDHSKKHKGIREHSKDKYGNIMDHKDDRDNKEANHHEQDNRRDSKDNKGNIVDHEDDRDNKEANHHEQDNLRDSKDNKGNIVDHKDDRDNKKANHHEQDNLRDSKDDKGNIVDHEDDRDNKEANHHEQDNLRDSKDDKGNIVDHKDDRDNKEANHHEQDNLRDSKDDKGKKVDHEDDRDNKKDYHHEQDNLRDSKDDKGKKVDHKDDRDNKEDYHHEQENLRDSKDDKGKKVDHKDDRDNKEDYHHEQENLRDSKDDKGKKVDHKDDRDNKEDYHHEQENLRDSKDDKGKKVDHEDDRDNKEDYHHEQENLRDSKDDKGKKVDHEDDRDNKEDYHHEQENLRDSKDDKGKKVDHEDDRDNKEDYHHEQENLRDSKDDKGKKVDHEDDRDNKKDYHHEQENLRDSKDDKGKKVDHEDDRDNKKDYHHEQENLRDSKDDKGKKVDHEDDRDNKKDYHHEQENLRDSKDDKGKKVDHKDDRDNKEDYHHEQKNLMDPKDDKGKNVDHEDDRDNKKDYHHEQDNLRDSKDDKGKKVDHEDDRDNKEANHDEQDNRGDFKDGKGNKVDRENDNDNNKKVHRHYKSDMEDPKDDKVKILKVKGNIEDSKDGKDRQRDPNDDEANQGSPKGGNGTLDDGENDKRNKNDHQNKSRENKGNISERKELQSSDIKHGKDYVEEKQPLREEKNRNINKEYDHSTADKEDLMRKSNARNADFNNDIAVGQRNGTKSKSHNVADIDRENIIKRTQNGQDKTKHESGDKHLQQGLNGIDEKSKPSSSKLKDSDKVSNHKNSTERKTNIEFPVHKKSLYHTLKDVGGQESDIHHQTPPQEKLNNLHNSSHSYSDIMDVNQNYADKLGNNSSSSKGIDDESQADKTKYFNQQANKWKEINSKENSVEDHGKYYNQMTKHWMSSQPKNESVEYFHEMTHELNWKNKTGAPDSGKYFNQRTKEWIKKENGGHNYSKKHKQNHQRISVPKTHRPESVPEENKQQEKSHGGLMEYNKVHEARQNVTVFKGKIHRHKKEKTFHVSQDRNDSRQNYSSKSGHNKTSWEVQPSSDKHNENKSRSNEILVNDRLQHIMSKKKENNKNSSKNAFGNKSRSNEILVNDRLQHITSKKKENNKNSSKNAFGNKSRSNEILVNDRLQHITSKKKENNKNSSKNAFGNKSRSNEILVNDRLQHIMSKKKENKNSSKNVFGNKSRSNEILVNDRLQHITSKKKENNKNSSKNAFGNKSRSNEILVNDRLQHITSKKNKKNKSSSKNTFGNKSRSNEILVNDRLQHITSKKKEKNKSSSKNAFGNKSSNRNGKQNGVMAGTKTRGEGQDRKWSDEKVKNEILKLIGPSPTASSSGKRNNSEKLNNGQTGFRKTPMFLNQKNLTAPTIKITKPNRQLTIKGFHARKQTSSAKPKHKIQGLISPLAYQHHQNNDKLHKSKFPLAVANKKNAGRILENGKKNQYKQPFKRPQTAEKQIQPKLVKVRKFFPRKPFHEQKLLNPPIKSKVLKPLTSDEHPYRIPDTLTNPRRVIIGKSRKTPTNKNMNNLAKPLSGLFDNSWTQGQTAVSPYTPTASSVQNWNTPGNVFGNKWKESGYNWPQYYSNTNEQTPTVPPTSSWNNMNWYSKNNQPRNNIGNLGSGGVENQNGIIKTTPAAYLNRELGVDGDKNTFNKDFWKSEAGNLYGRQPGIQRVINPVTTPRQNYIYDSSKHNEKLIHVGQNDDRQTTAPTKTGKNFKTQKFLEPVVNGSSRNTWKKKVGPQVGQSTSRINISPNQNKVLGIVGKPLQPQQQKTKSKSSIPHVKVIQRPLTSYLNKTKPPINNVRVFTTSKPTIGTKQWSKTNSTSGIVSPFKIDKLEPLSPEVSKNLTTKTGKVVSKPASPIPKGCYPGEIMSEMTLANGLEAGNFTKIGRTELMDTCISKCCRIKTCEVAIQMDNVCFAIQCRSKETCKIQTTLGKSSHHKLCFISRRKKERQSMNDFDDDILGTQDVCPNQTAVGLNWKKTTAGSSNEIPCPKKAKGLARRRCSVESQWLLPDFSSCVTKDYEELYKRAKRLVYGEGMSPLLQSLAVVTTRTIENSLIFGGDLKKSTEIMTSVVQEQGVKSENNINNKDLKNFLVTCSNLLDDSNKQEWKNIQKNTRGSSEILRNSQIFALLSSSNLLEPNGNLTYVANNIMLQMNQRVKGSKVMTIPDYNNSEIALWDGEKDHLELPDSIFSIGDVKIISFSYKTLAALLPMKSDEHFRRSEPNSKILTSIVVPRIQDKITPPITITFHHLKESRINPKCVFWDFNLNPTHGGAWSTQGCWLEHSDKKHSVCRCNHLSSFAVLMDIVDAESMQVTSKDERYFREKAALWICAPVLVVLIIAGLYIAFTWSRGPRYNSQRPLNEKSSLLRSSVTTEEIRYDYSSSPLHHVYSENSPKFKELEWQNEFRMRNKKNGGNKDMLRPNSSYTDAADGIEQDSGIESNDLDESSTHCDLSLSQDSLSIEVDSVISDVDKKENESSNAEISEAESGFYNINEPAGGSSNLNRLEVERRVFSTHLRRCTGNDDLSNNCKGVQRHL